MIKFLQDIIIQRLAKVDITVRATDRGGAEILYSCLKGYVKFNNTSKCWLIYDSTHWVIDQKSQINELMLFVVKNFYLRKQNADGPFQWGYWLLSWENVSVAKKILESFSMMENISITDQELDCDHYLFNLHNGTYNFREKKLQKHSPSDLITKCADYDYDEQQTPKRWIRFLKEIFNNDIELIAFIRMFIGVSLTGDSSFPYLVFFFGSGKNGKSILIRMIMKLLGKDNVIKLPTRVVQSSGYNNQGQIQNEIARLKGMRLAVTNELEQDQVLSEATIKDITGNDVLIGNYKYKDSFDFIPTHKLLMYGNHKPAIKGKDNGIWRRIALVPFNITIDANKEIPSDILIDDLSKELPGIFNWAVNGYRQWESWDKKLPKTIIEETKSYRFENDVVANFIYQKVQMKKGNDLKQDDLFNAYLKWCEINEHRPLLKKSLTTDLKKKGWVSRIGGGRKTIWLDRALK